MCLSETRISVLKMIHINFTPEQIDDIYDEFINHKDSRIRKKLLVIYLKAQGLFHKDIAAIARVTDDTVTNYLKEYQEGGLERLIENRYYKPESQLDPYIEELRKIFEKEPPNTVAQAAHRIHEETGILLQPTACRDFLKSRLRMRVRRVGIIPSKADPDKQKEYVQSKLEPRLEEAKEGKRAVYFVDAAHFVMGAFLGFLWCFCRVFLRSSAGRQRYNVLGAINAVDHQLTTVTNETYINRFSVCDLMEKIVNSHSDIPITLVLDNARYQRAKLVQEKAKEFGVELLFLPAYSPNLNLIERLWRFIKKKCLYNKYYENFEAFKKAIDECIGDLTVKYKEDIERLMTLKFQLFDKSEIITV